MYKYIFKIIDLLWELRQTRRTSTGSSSNKIVVSASVNRHKSVIAKTSTGELNHEDTRYV